MNLFEKTAQKYPKIVEKMCLAAILAGARIMEVYSEEDFGVEMKDDHSPITRADGLADKVIGKTLKQQKALLIQLAGLKLGITVI